MEILPVDFGELSRWIVGNSSGGCWGILPVDVWRFFRWILGNSSGGRHATIHWMVSSVSLFRQGPPRSESTPPKLSQAPPRTCKLLQAQAQLRAFQISSGHSPPCHHLERCLASDTFFNWNATPKQNTSAPMGARPSVLTQTIHGQRAELVQLERGAARAHPKEARGGLALKSAASSEAHRGGGKERI